MFGKASRCAACPDGYEHGVSIQDAGSCEITKLRAVNDIHKHSRTAKIDRCNLARFGIFISHKSDAHAFVYRALFIVLDYATSALHQAPFWLRRVSLSQHQDALSFDVVKKGKALKLAHVRGSIQPFGNALCVHNRACINAVCDDGKLVSIHQHLGYETA